MLSNVMLKVLIVEYIVIGGVCVLEHNYPKALYWLSAGLISVSVLWGMK